VCLSKQLNLSTYLTNIIKVDIVEQKTRLNYFHTSHKVSGFHMLPSKTYEHIIDISSTID